MFPPHPSFADAKPTFLASALTVHRTVIHCLTATSLPQGEGLPYSLKVSALRSRPIHPFRVPINFNSENVAHDEIMQFPIR